jgi:hypothetical protein
MYDIGLQDVSALALLQASGDFNNKSVSIMTANSQNIAYGLANTDQTMSNIIYLSVCPSVYPLFLIGRVRR